MSGIMEAAMMKERCGGEEGARFPAHLPTLAVSMNRACAEHGADRNRSLMS